VVPLDHGLVAGPVAGIEDPVGLVKRIAQSDADAVLVTPGILEQVAGELDQLAVILRVDGCTSVQTGGAMRQFVSVAHAAEMGADAVIVNVTVGGDHETVELLKLGQVAEEARRWGMPLVAEMLGARLMANHLDFTGQGRAALPENIADDIALAARIGAEMGADLIKTRYSGDEESFRRIITSTGRPVMVAGGPLRDTSLRALLDMVDQCLSAGAEGVIFGRNVWQHPRPEAVLTALAAMVHEGASVEQALDAANARESLAVG
jgi:fructose-bisphosphate aldolase/2-amino-3,7-dideoxy-D-threo-hept-6-ulosonate synthase